MRLAALLLIMPRGAVAQQAVTAGQLMANGFEVRASYMVEKGTPVLVLQKGADAYLCSPLQGGRLQGRIPHFASLMRATVSRHHRALNRWSILTRRMDCRIKSGNDDRRQA